MAWVLEEEVPPERLGRWVLEPTPTLGERIVGLTRQFTGGEDTEDISDVGTARRVVAEAGSPTLQVSGPPVQPSAVARQGAPVVPPVVQAERLKEVPEPLLPGLPAPVSDVVRSAVTKAVREGTGALAEAEQAGRVPTREAAGLPPTYPGESQGIKPASIAAAAPRERGYLERALTSAGLLEPSEAERRVAARTRADIGQGKQEPPTALGRAMKQALSIGGQALGGAAESATLGLLPAVARAYGLTVPEAETSLEKVSKGLGGLAGFIRGPALAAGRVAFEGFLKPVAKDAIGKILAKQIAREAPVLATASTILATGQALEQPEKKAAVQTLGEAAKGGAIMGAVFGGVPGLIMGRSAFQTAARAGLGIAILDAAEGRRPWDERDIAEKAFDYGLDAYFLFTGRDPRAIQAALRQVAKKTGASPESVLRVVFLQSEADRGLRTQQDVAAERARLLGEKLEIPPSEAAEPQPEAIPTAAEAGLARREIGPPEAKAVPPEVKAAAPEIKALVDQFRRPVEVEKPEAVPSGPLRTAKELAGAAPEVPILPAERQTAAQAQLAAETALRRYQDVPSTFYEFARERGRWPITTTDPGYMALRRGWDEVRKPLYEVQGPRLGQWEVVNRVTRAVEAQSPNKAMAQLQANKMDLARVRRLPPEEFRPKPPFKPAEPPVAPPAEAERPEPERLVTPRVTPEARPEVPVAEPKREGAPPVSKPKPIAEALGGEPEGFDPNDVDQLK